MLQKNGQIFLPCQVLKSSSNMTDYICLLCASGPKENCSFCLLPIMNVFFFHVPLMLSKSTSGLALLCHNAKPMVCKSPASAASLPFSECALSVLLSTSAKQVWNIQWNKGQGQLRPQMLWGCFNNESTVSRQVKSFYPTREQRVTASHHRLCLGSDLCSFDCLGSMKLKQQHLYACSIVSGAEEQNLLLSCCITTVLHQYHVCAQSCFSSTPFLFPSASYPCLSQFCWCTGKTWRRRALNAFPSPLTWSLPQRNGNWTNHWVGDVSDECSRHLLSHSWHAKVLLCSDSPVLVLSALTRLLYLENALCS